MATTEEQETIITQNRSDDFVSVYTSNGFDLAYFDKRPEFVLVREWFDPDSGERDSAEFHIPRELVNIRKIVKAKRAPMTPAQLAALAKGRDNAQKS